MNPSKPKTILVIERKIKKEHTYEEFRKTWLPPGIAVDPAMEPANYYPVPVQVINAVNVNDPFEIMSVSLINEDYQTLFRELGKYEKQDNERRDAQVPLLENEPSWKAYEVRDINELGTDLRTIVEQYIRTYNAMDVNQMLSLFAEDCTFESVSNAGHSYKCVGKEQLRELATQSATVFEQREQKITNWIVGSDKVSVELEYHAVFAKDLPNGPKAGQKIDLRGMSVFEFRGSSIFRLVDYS